MYVLSRKVDESIVIGDGIKVTITQIGKSRVRVGVEAPDDLLVRRQELKVKGDSLVVEPVEVE